MPSGNHSPVGASCTAMIIGRVVYHLEEAFRSLSRNLLTSAVALATITFSFLIFSTFLLIVVNLELALEEWGRHLTVVAYLRSDISPRELTGLEEEIGTWQEVAEVTFISKEDAWSSLKRSLEGQESILEGLDGNPLPPSFVIGLKPEHRYFSDMESFAIRLKGLAGIDDVEYGRKWVEGFLTVVDLARLVCLTVGGFLFIAMVFIVSNTIRLAIYHRKDEIEIMKLVGATNFFVRAPFLIEGTLQGLFGSALSLAILFGVYRLLLVKAVPTLEPLVGPFTLSFLSRDYSVGIMIAGLFLGILGSMVSIEKFLKASP